MAASAREFDFVICGAGLAGCVIASRLSAAGHSVALLETGRHGYTDTIMRSSGAPQLAGTEWLHNMMSTAQPQLGGRKLVVQAGRLVSGSSAVNYGNWTRGDRADYDNWAKRVDDPRWSYDSLLKYFQETETHHDVTDDPAVHGFEGPIKTTAHARKYPLNQVIRDAFVQSGHAFNPDANSGNPIGLANMTENWDNGKRQPAGKAFDLTRVNVFDSSQVARIELEDADFPQKRRARRAILLSGESFIAKKEIIVCCGALWTPQLLMNSGIGPQDELSRHGIPCLVDLPVGQNLHDRAGLALFWELRRPENGLALGSPIFNKPEYALGNPIDWIVTSPLPRESLARVKGDGMDVNDPFFRQDSGHIEIMTCYGPIGATDFRPPMDGSVISTVVLAMLPRSRGTVTLADRSATSAPLVDLQHLTDEVDCEVMRSGLRMAIRAMNTSEASAEIKGELPPPSYAALTEASSDAELDARLTHGLRSYFQFAGTAAMGPVVDSECRVKGVEGLRVCDASIIPSPLTAHYQAPLYAIALAASDMILSAA